MLTLTLITLISAKPVSLASPGWASADVDPRRTLFFADHLAAQISAQGISVVTGTEIRQTLALERQKQLLGCDTSNCLAEISGALGVDGVITGTVAKVGKRLAVTLKIVSPSNRTLALADLQADSESDLIELLNREAPRLAEDVRIALFGKPSPLQSLRRVWWAPGVAGVAAFALGATFTGLSWSRFSALTAHDQSAVGADPVAFAQTGQTFQTAGLITAAGGLAVLLSTVLLLALVPAEAPALTVSLGPTGGAISVRW